jgi:hypothetical protein
MGEMIDIRSRAELPELMGSFGLNGLVVEIGVETGENAEVYYKALLADKISGVVLIDPWDASSYIAKRTQEEMHDIYESVVKKFDHPCVTILRTTSAEAACRFSAGSCDLVYIDGLHDYEHASEDITLWWPKVCTGGILAGHDYNMSGVARALTKFKKDNPCTDVRYSLEKADPSWWARKI